MRKIWKELISILCFISIYGILIYEHEKHMGNVVVKEIPYILILLFSVVVILWSIDKMKVYQQKSKLNRKMQDLCDQYDFEYDENEHTLSNCESLLDQFNQQLKQDELNLDTFEYRYRKIADITGLIIFEYNFANDTICDSLNWHAVGNAHQFVEESIQHEIVHPEDAELFRNYFTNPPIVGAISEIHIRLRTKNDPTYYITDIRGIVLEGLNGEAEKIIGSRIQRGKA
ncbi:hypothetical protein [Amedibacillus sp. YH-ame10]